MPTEPKPLLPVDNGLVVAEKHDLERSKKWPTVRSKYLKVNPTCAICGGTTDLQVHHVVPFHFCILVAERPDLELDPRNLITLCQDPKTDHHLIAGHLNDFHSYNPDVRKSVKHKKTGWLASMFDSVLSALKLKPKPKPLAKMTDKDKIKFKAMVLKLYPDVQVKV